MTTKERVLQILEENYGNYVSGEKIAKSLGISRNAVSKNVFGLKNEGYNIKSEKNNGHMLCALNDVISSYGIDKYLDFECNTVVYNEIGSTNDFIKEIFNQSVPEFFTVIAKKQNKGKGRLGRSFFSPEETGVYFSFLLKPDFEINISNIITTCASVAVVRAIKKIFPEIKPEIKWVNDVFANGKKVCGILTEGMYNVEVGKFDYVVVGIGINVYFPENGFPEEIKNIAGALSKEKKNDGRNKLIANILNEFHKIYMHYDANEINTEYKENCFVIGKRVNVVKNGEERPAKAESIDELFRLIVKYDDGTKEALQSGEISIKV